MFNEWLVTQKYKSQLKKAFYSGGLYLTHKKKSYVHYILPKIHTVKLKDNSMQIVFTLPLGLDPKEVIKSDWLFKQQFGENVKLKQENKKFVLTIYNEGLKKVIPYRFETLHPIMKEYKLPVVIGKDKNGKIILVDLIKHPHLLVAGETGSGKSVFLRTMITSLIQHMKPGQLELYLGDPKMVEFFLFENVPIVKGFANEPDEIGKMVQKVVKQMKTRKKLMKEEKVPHIDKYNKKAEKKLPYILLCIDEFAELQSEGSIKKDIEWISSQGRAFGIILCLSLQRPDRDTMDGKLKNNMTMRIAFKMADKVNSRIILDSYEAASISSEDSGRMFYKLNGIHEAQAFYLDEEDAETILEEYKSIEEEVNIVETIVQDEPTTISEDTTVTIVDSIEESPVKPTFKANLLGSGEDGK
ncbi:DNA translocase FtsK [Fictibacillus sp. 5RED26]|uniref:FtsK/SpoIIIE domain-containing protein n=1 Tax=Fictibacillus sp. 5RED26 TaxID=2745876 RepID=UPI0018CD53A5|nr:FtsK/SpoIIIE domain-containing protein [Fictibacillus sp. 5RED26]MBH0156006.1 DNA translocase FtsK [Fictibacillus sp. 5RED26]